MQETRDLVHGYEPILKINGTIVTYRSCDVTLNRDGTNVNSSADGKYKVEREDHVGFDAEFTFTADYDINPHADPLFISDLTNEYVDIEYFPRGIEHDPYHAPYFLVKRVSVRINAETGMEEYSISGSSAGTFTVPTDA